MPQAQVHSGNAHARSGNGSSGFRISADEHPQDHLLPAVNHKLAQAPFTTQIEVLGEGPLEGLVIWRSLPGLDFMWAESSPIITTRTEPVLAEGSDSILFTVFNTSRVFRVFGKEHESVADQGVAFGNAGPGRSIAPLPHKQVTVIVPQRALMPLLREKNAHFVLPLLQNSAAMQLLIGYLDMLKEAPVPAELQASIVAHLYDLLAVALGPSPDGLELAQKRGLRAARLYAVKKDVIRGLAGNPSINTVAARHRLTPRYVQMLFDDEGTTFTQFVREQRLARARSMLASPRFDHKRIGEIAYEVGFGDLSYFNRAFRRRFGLSPRDIREGARTRGGRPRDPESVSETAEADRGVQQRDVANKPGVGKPAAH